MGPYRVKGRRGRIDANEAVVVCEDASGPSIRFVPFSKAEQQAALTVHRLREGYIGGVTACINSIRGLFAGRHFKQNCQSTF